MQKKNNKIGPRYYQRQKLKRKMVLVGAASFIGCMIVALIIFFKTNRVDQSMAAGSTYMVTEEPPVTDFTLDAPILKKGEGPGENTLLVRAVKHEQKNGFQNKH